MTIHNAAPKLDTTSRKIDIGHELLRAIIPKSWCRRLLVITAACESNYPR
jgi:hypothetical protein